MESVWDYIMRRKPVFLGYFAIFLISIFASCGLLNTILSQNPANEPGIVQETPKPENYDRVLSPEMVANLTLSEDGQSLASNSVISTSSPAQNFIHIDIANSSETPTDPILPPDSVINNPETSNDANQNQTIANQQSPTVDVPLTGNPQADASSSPRKVSIFRTILAVLLAVTALTLAGIGLYQAYDYFAPFIDEYRK